jgi:hypothetical protein
MKISVAKVFCFLTVLLLSCNVVFSSNQSIKAISHKKEIAKSLVDKIQLRTSQPTDSHFNFLNENDPFEEDVELLSEQPEEFVFVSPAVVHYEQSFSAFTPQIHLELKIPIWLFVRQIII